MMTRAMAWIAVLGLAGGLISSHPAAASQQVYRCQGTDGKPVFSDKPCGANARTVNLKIPERPGAGIGMRCVFERDEKACEQYRQLRETDPQAWQEELLRVREAMTQRQLQQRQDSLKYQECVQRNLTQLAKERGSGGISGYQRAYVQGRCYENPEIMVDRLPADPQMYRTRKRYVRP